MELDVTSPTACDAAVSLAKGNAGITAYARVAECADDE